MHVNNVALMALAQEGRVRFHHASGYAGDRDGATTMVASFTIEFLGEAFYPDPLDLHAAIGRVGRTSHQVDQLVTQKGRVVAWAQSVIVNVRDGRPAALTSGFLETCQSWMLRP